MLYTEKQVALVATTFSRLLGEYITRPAWRRDIITKNATCHPSVCHTHDYLDANEVMAEAIDLCGEELFNSEGDIVEATELWNRAWDRAKKDNFGWTKAGAVRPRRMSR